MFDLEPILACEFSRPLLRQWCNAFQQKGKAVFADFDPIAFPKSLPFLSVFAFDEEVQDYYCRLAGEEVANSQRARMKGRYLPELYDAGLARSIRERWEEARQSSRPMIVWAALPIQPKNPAANAQERVSWRVILPVRDEQKGEDLMLSLSIYHYDANYYHKPLAPNAYHCRLLGNEDLEYISNL